MTEDDIVTACTGIAVAILVVGILSVVPSMFQQINADTVDEEVYEEDISSLEAEINELESTISQLQSEKEHYQAVASNYSDNRSDLREQADYYEEKSENQSELIENQEQEIEELEDEVERTLSVRNIREYDIVVPVIQRSVNIVYLSISIVISILVLIPISFTAIKIKFEINVVEQLAELYKRRHDIWKTITTRLSNLWNQLLGAEQPQKSS